jgi:rod shape-determining protein MreC
MTAKRRAAHYFLAVFLLALPLALLTSSLKSPGRLNAFDRAVLAVASPLQRAVAWVVDGVGDAWHHYVWLVDVQKENDELRRENERLRQGLGAATRKANEAEGLEALVELRERIPAQTIGARVVAVGLSPSFRVSRVVLDRGEGEVAPGMPVIAGEGVVGRIQRVYGGYADVTLAVDPQSSIDVVLPRTASRGVLKGLGGDNAYTAKIEYLLKGEEVKEDDPVVTSGLGGVFPKDLAIGRVRRIVKTEYGLYQEVEVKPAVDFSRLSRVLVMLAPPPPPDPGAKTKKAPEQAFGLSPYR